MVLLVGKRFNVFGWYNSKKFPLNGYIKNDFSHLVFTLQNRYNIPPTPFYPLKKKCESGALLISDEIVLALKRTMNIIKLKEGGFKVEMGMKFNQRYNDLTLCGDLIFTKDENILDKIVLVEWM